MNRFAIILLLSLFGSQARAFSFTFSWEGLRLCNTGYPNRVFNPPFRLKNVPKGTKWIEFRLTDKNVPGFNHGGGWVRFTGNKKIGRDQFKYQSPCPPGGVHRYEWSARAKTKKSGGKILGRAKSGLNYP